MLLNNMEAIILGFHLLLQQSYWKQFEHGMLSREAVRKLVELTESAGDVEGEFINIDDIRKCFKIGKIHVYMVTN